LWCLTAGHFRPPECFTISRRLYGDEEEEGRQEDGEEVREEEEVAFAEMQRGR
jgi:hypothetical protein